MLLEVILKLPNRQVERTVDQAVDLKDVFFWINLRNRAMVPVIRLFGCEEAMMI